MARPLAVNLHESIWLPYKELYNVVYTAVFKRDSDILPELESTLKKHTPDFIALLSNPPKNVESREIVRKGSSEGIPIIGQQMPQIISQQMIDESLILSDLFQLNEVAAVELLLAGECQQSNFVGLNRGLVAVLLYYDGRQSLVASLRALIQAREGRTWTLGLSHEVSTLATKFTDRLMAEGLVRKILDLLLEMNFTKELDKLQKNRALGTPRHRKQVVDLMTEIRQTLAECLYCWACQSAMTADDTLQLLSFLMRHNHVGADGTMDNVTLALLMVVLYAIDVSVLEQTEDSEALIQKLPICSDPGFVPAVHKELTSGAHWESPELKAVIQLAWAVSLRILSQQPNTQGLNVYFEEDETIVDQAVNNNVFHFLHNVVLANSTFHLEEFYVKRMHNLVTDFIIHMPLKVKELRNCGDEIARIIMAHEQEGLEPPHNLQRHFEHMMLMISTLYAKDPLKLELISEYWCPIEMSPGFSTMYPYRLPQKQVNLYKFVRLAGDLLLPSLYVPYVSMLTSLSKSPTCAYHCFNLLKLNGTSTGGHCSMVGWDHFFTSLHRYYANLRQEIPLVSDVHHLYRQRPTIRGITPLELDGLTAVLRLMRTVAEQDEMARVAMCENQHWLPLVVLMGLIGCCVPAPFKAELLHTLAAFARSPAIGANMWHSLEVAQVVQTVKTTSTYASSGIQTELDEVEARNEEFPMTRAFLALLSTLVDVPIPPTLGAGFRAPGFDPYFEFVRDSVFLKFNTRAYKNGGEKWSVAAGCLVIFYKLLKSHDVQSEDFVNQVAELQGGGSTTVNKRPGHSILIYLLHDSAMLKMILYIIHESVRLLSQFINFPGKEDLQRCALLCLKLLSLVLTKQTKFLDLLRESGSSLLVNSVDKLLLSINPRSGRPDHLVSITRFTTFSSSLPEHVLYVTKILTVLCHSPVIQPQLVTLFTMDQLLTRELLNGFVETLDTDETESMEQFTTSEPDDDIESESQLRQMSRQTIVNLLLACLRHPAPNLAHFLLGFELRKPVAKTVLQEPGVLGSPHTCLHVILTQLLRGTDSRTGPLCVRESPSLGEGYFHLITDLCANKYTSGPILRYLRTTHDFLFRQLTHLPFKSQENERSSPLLLLQQAWILKAVAIEVHVTSINRQRSHVQRLVSLLVDDNPEVSRGLLTIDHTTDSDGPLIDNTTIGGLSQLKPSNIVTGALVRRKLLAILDVINFSEDFPETPQWEYFDSASVDQVVNQCEQRHPTGLVLVNVQNLHYLLQRELNELQVPAALGQRPLIAQEIQNILSYVVKRNKVRESIHAKRQAFDAWRQVTETILTAYPPDLLDGEKRQTVLFELLQELMHKVLDHTSIPELSHLVSGVVLTLLANLRQCFFAGGLVAPSSTTLASVGSVSMFGMDRGQQLTLLDGSSLAPEASFALSTRSFHSSSLQVVLKGLLECIMKSGGGPQRVRANYYASLLNFLRIAQTPKDFPTLESGFEFVSRFDRDGMDRELEHEKLTRENMEMILSYGEHLMEVVCRDCCTSHDINRMLTLACVDVIVSSDRNQHWLNYLNSKGYLRHLVESLAHDDEQLQKLILSSAEPYRALYIYESKMALLSRLALSTAGANALLENGVMTTLAECKVFDLRPEQDTSESSLILPQPFNGNSSVDEDGFLVLAIGRYRQVLFPALRLCLAISTALGQENALSATHVLAFVVAHVEVLCTILRERHVVVTYAALEELSLVARVVARARHGDSSVMDSSSILDVEGQVLRLRRLMVSLLQRYALTEQLEQHVTANLPQGFAHNMAHNMLLEILAAATTYATQWVSVQAGDRRLSPIVFLPNLVEAVTRDAFNLKEFQMTFSVPRTPNLGVVVYHLHRCVELFLLAYDAHKTLMKKLENLSELSPDEMKEFLNLSSVPMATDKMSTQARKMAVRQSLLKMLAYKAQEVKLLAYMVENSLYLVWLHLEHYLVNCSLSDLSVALGPRVNQSRDLLPENRGSLAPEDIRQLKADVLSCINETLFRKLQEIAQVYTSKTTHCSFIEALVRRVKRIVRLHIK